MDYKQQLNLEINNECALIKGCWFEQREGQCARTV